MGRNGAFSWKVGDDATRFTIFEPMLGATTLCDEAPALPVFACRNVRRESDGNQSTIDQ